ncbi:hypothetical protein BDP55DRAFT_626092 [Colletotrichum godetiae]|uniref:Uncharacterized protein n=1 Tax=Colletotrichum godetiae TaxID=1209918 RepID=A0AAJ0AY93_9PEZI|nr:uncharacterized protein BDP55DRAFT_626092 [Colletotrichum godetiae]KAK1700525.1 hypothetical protein BDP55DRAFT_626092 [Colletotrichum godetiae]
MPGSVLYEIRHSTDDLVPSSPNLLSSSYRTAVQARMLYVPHSLSRSTRNRPMTEKTGQEKRRNERTRKCIAGGSKEKKRSTTHRNIVLNASLTPPGRSCNTFLVLPSHLSKLLVTEVRSKPALAPSSASLFPSRYPASLYSSPDHRRAYLLLLACFEKLSFHLFVRVSSPRGIVDHGGVGLSPVWLDEYG